MGLHKPNSITPLLWVPDLHPPPTLLTFTITVSKRLRTQSRSIGLSCRHYRFSRTLYPQKIRRDCPFSKTTLCSIERKGPFRKSLFFIDPDVYDREWHGIRTQTYTDPTKSLRFWYRRVRIVFSTRWTWCRSMRTLVSGIDRVPYIDGDGRSRDWYVSNKVTPT